MLEKQLTEWLGRSHGVLCGRGTTAVWLAVRAILRRDGPGEIILPDLLCSTVPEGVLLAGGKLVFADVNHDRFTISPESVAERITPETRAIIVAHLFGHIADIDLIRQAAPGIPIIEDAVQGLGGHFRDQLVGSLGDLSLISFDEYKMIGGRGGALFFDDGSLLEGIENDLRHFDLPEITLDTLLLSPAAAAAYEYQLRTFAAPALLRRFDPSPANLERIRTGWQTLAARVEVRNAKAHWLQDQLAHLPLQLPDLREGDAVWRYTITATTAAWATRIKRGLQLAGLSGSDLYYPLSQFYGQQTGGLANRLVNLWVDESITPDILQQNVNVITSLPWPQNF